MQISAASNAKSAGIGLLGKSLALAAIGLLSVSANAATILGVDAGYYRFGLDAIGAEVGARAADGGLLASDGSPFTFTAVRDVVLRVVDLQLSLDRFQVIINDVDQGPGSLALLGLGFAGLVASRRRKR